MNVKNEIENIYELTPLQKGILFNKLNKDKGNDYHVQFEVEYDFQLDNDKVEMCMNLLNDKYEMLRTAFVIPKSTGVPKQVVLKHRSPEIHYLNGDVDMEQIKTNDLDNPFDLQKDCLLRVYLINYPCSSKILFSFHHIIMDGWSADILMSEFDELYKKVAKGENLANYSENPFKFSDYIKWINKQGSLQGIEYWKELLSGYENSLSIDKTPIKDSTLGNMERTKKVLSIELSVKVIELSKQLNVTVNSIVESIWGLTLCKYNYADDAVFGKVVSGRQADIKGIENAIGLFINTIPARVKISEDETVEELIVKTHKQGIESIEYSYCSVGDIKKEFSQNILNTIFVFENYGNNNGGSKEDGMRVVSAREQVDCDITCVAFLDDDILNVELMYDPHDYTSEDMQVVLDRMEKMILQICHSPMMKIGDIELTLDDELKQMFNNFNMSDFEIGSDDIIQMFNKKVVENPNKIIAACNDQEISYLEIENGVNSLAEELRRRGVKKQDYVIIMINRDIDILIIMLSILTVGAIYVPIDKSYPKKRIEYILADTGARMIITDDSEVYYPKCELINIKRDNIYEKKVGCDVRKEQINDDDVAYCLYTSGTTGKPKGVMVTHGNLRNYCANNIYNIRGKAIKDDDLVILSVTTFSFDIFVTESILALINGIKVVIANNDEFNCPDKIKSLIDKYNVNIIQTTPSKMKLFLTGMERISPKIKVIILGGESVTDELCGRIRKISNARIYNAYGPTETTVFSTCCEFEHENILGRPIANTKIFVMNGKQKCGVGMVGEVCILGKGVSKGYINNEQLTGQKFLITEDGRMYKSGDLGKWTKDGEILFLGRRDEQVKIRGLRIELREIEECIKNIDGVKEIAVLVDKSNICVFYTSDNQIDNSLIRSYLSDYLPNYMVPSRYIKVDKMPVNINGKLDKKKLLLLNVDKKQKEYIPPKTQKETEIIAVFEVVLNKEKISLDDNFFELGGDSMKAIIAITKLKNAGYDLSLRDLMKAIRFENIVKRSIEI